MFVVVVVVVVDIYTLVYFLCRRTSPYWDIPKCGFWQMRPMFVVVVVVYIYFGLFLCWRTSPCWDTAMWVPASASQRWEIGLSTGYSFIIGGGTWSEDRGQSTSSSFQGIGRVKKVEIHEMRTGAGSSSECWELLSSVLARPTENEKSSVKRLQDGTKQKCGTVVALCAETLCLR